MKDKTTNKGKPQLTAEEARDILDRIIGFVGNCDNKASIMLGIIGVVLAIVFTNDCFTEINRIVKIIFQEFSWFNGIFLLVGIISLISLFYGLIMLIRSLIAKTNCDNYTQEELDLNSSIFFQNIANCRSFAQYKAKFLAATEEIYLNDIISQIYINSLICTLKFKRYNRGVIYSMCGLVVFILLVISGAIIY